MKVTYHKPTHSALGEPILPVDSFWEASVLSDTHRVIISAEGKTKVEAKRNLQRLINDRLEMKVRKYTNMLRMVTSQEV